MKIKLLLNQSVLGLALFSSTALLAQEKTNVIPCITDQAMEDVFAKDPSARERYNKAQAKHLVEYKQALLNKDAKSKIAAPVYTVPVVFHILHQGGPENVSDAAIQSALDYVNKDFARTNSDANTTNEPFRTLYIDSEIHFALAKKDPNGNCTNGIVRHIDENADWKQTGTLTNYKYTWDPTRYLNFYIVANIVPQSTVTGGGIIVGYTYKPGTWPTGADQDAIVYRYNYLTGGDNPRSLTHEIGHWLNLSHTWGNTNNPGVACGDDGVDDTPITRGEFSGCPTTSATACTQTNAAMNNLNNVQNIMNYSSCAKNFTSGQTTKMRTAIESNTSGRDNLWSASNLVFTDINSTTQCAPISSFMSIASNEYTVCAGQYINSFKDFSYNGTITSHNWGATNSATIASPTSSMTTMYFPNPGSSIVTLTVTNSFGSSTSSRTVTVIDGAQTASIGIESFEAASTPANWTIRNFNTSSVTWAQTTSSASDGSKSFFINGQLNPANHIDVLETPFIDLSAVQNFSLNFKYAYRRQTATHADVFKVQMSDDCGATWKDVWSPSASQLAAGSGETSTANFIPSASQWMFKDVSNHPNFSSFSVSKSVMARFYFQEAPTGFGNRLYLDEIGFLTPDVGVNEITAHLNLRLYPNPTNGTSNLNFVLSNDAKVKVSVIDVLGKSVDGEKVYNFGAGDHSVIINENNQLKTGVYVVNLEYNGVKIARKLIIQ